MEFTHFLKHYHLKHGLNIKLKHPYFTPHFTMKTKKQLHF